MNKQVKNSVVNFAGRIANIFIVIVFAPIYLNILGAEAYGLVAFLVSVTALASLFDFGLSSTFGRLVAFDSSHESVMKCLATFGRLLALSSAVASLFLIVFAESIATHWFQNTGKLNTALIVNCIRILALTLIPHFQVNLMIIGLMSQLRQVEGNLVLIVYNLMRSGLVLIALVIWPNVLVLFVWQLGAALIALFFTRVLLFRNSGTAVFSRAAFSTSLASSAASFATGMFFISVVAVCNTQLDKLIVSKFFSLKDLADYTLASTLAQIPLTITTPISVSLYPFLIKQISENSLVALNCTYDRLSQIIFYLSLSACANLIMFRREVLEVWLGEHNLRPESTLILSMITVGNLFLCLSLAPYNRLLAQGITRPLAIVTAISFLSSIPISLISVSKLGLIGAAVPWMFLNAINFVFTSKIANVGNITLDKSWKIGKLLRYLELTVFAVAPAFAASILSSRLEMGNKFVLLLVCMLAGLATILCYLRGHFGNLRRHVSE